MSLLSFKKSKGDSGVDESVGSPVPVRNIGAKPRKNPKKLKGAVESVASLRNTESGSVFTRWGSRDCGSESDRIYEGKLHKTSYI